VRFQGCGQSVCGRAGQFGGLAEFGEGAWLVGDGGEDEHCSIENFDAAS
jgi:hypothetical protein